MLGVPSRCFLRIDEVAVHRDLVDPPTRRDDLHIRDLVFELCEQKVRQTDGSRPVASLCAVLDHDLHDREV